MLLTETELQALTGRRRVDAQKRALEAMGLPYRVRHDGTLVVIRSHVERDPRDSSPSVREPQLRL